MNKKALFLVLFAAVVFPVIADAQTIADLLNNVVTNVVWPVAIACVVVFWVATGILFLAGLGQPEKIKLARTSLIAAVIGTVVIILAASVITIIRNTLGI